MQMYDGIDYRYSSSDPDRSKAIEIITNILGVEPSLDGLDYSLNLYAGGTGIDDRVAIRFKCEPLDWPAVVQKHRLRLPAEAIASPDWAESFEWLVCGNRPTEGVAADVRQFVARNKHAFQSPANSDTVIWFSDESDVNSWCVIWKTDEWRNYLSFDQG